MTPDVVTQIRPMEWADALAKIGWPFVLLAFWYVFWKNNPWKKTKE